MRTFLLRASLVVALIAAASCAETARVNLEAGALDASVDSAVDAASDGDVDATTDASNDGAVDATTDASSDGAVDATTDASSDGAVDATTDASSDGAVDAAVDASTDGATDACVLPPCAAPPPGCHYEVGAPCTCGTLVCDCPSTPPASCCYADADCSGSIAGGRCIGEQCGPAGSATAGVCVAAASKGQCWEDADCAAGEVCQGVARCPCGALCILPDHPGTCVASALL